MRLVWTRKRHECAVWGAVRGPRLVWTRRRHECAVWGARPPVGLDAKAVRAAGCGHVIAPGWVGSLCGANARGRR